MSNRIPQPGDRIRTTGPLPSQHHGVDPGSPPVGTEGTVTSVGPMLSFGYAQIHVDWDDGSGLMLLSTDPFTITHRPEPRHAGLRSVD
jgi:hypothetical protein